MNEKKTGRIIFPCRIHSLEQREQERGEWIPFDTWAPFSPTRKGRIRFHISYSPPYTTKQQQKTAESVSIPCFTHTNNETKTKKADGSITESYSPTQATKQKKPVESIPNRIRPHEQHNTKKTAVAVPKSYSPTVVSHTNAEGSATKTLFGPKIQKASKNVKGLHRSFSNPVHLVYVCRNHHRSSRVSKKAHHTTEGRG